MYEHAHVHVVEDVYEHAHVHVVEDVYDSDAEKYVTALEIHAMDKPHDKKIICLNPKINGTPL